MTKIILDRKPSVCNLSLFPEHFTAFRIGVFNHIKVMSRVLGSYYVSLCYLYPLVKAAEIKLAHRVGKMLPKTFWIILCCGLSCALYPKDMPRPCLPVPVNVTLLEKGSS